MEGGTQTSRAHQNPQNDEILEVSFNQDYTALQIGTENGYRLFATTPDKNAIASQDQDIYLAPNAASLPYREVFIIERLFNSALIVVVTKAARRIMKACHFKNCSEICALQFPNNILTIKFNRSRLVVCLEASLHIVNMRDMKVLHIINDEVGNKDGVIALSTNENNSILAYPKSAITGEIIIFDTIKLRPTTTIAAHKNPIVAMQFDAMGTKIATASSQGTLIRVHDINNGTCLYDLRRSSTRSATIYSLAFSSDGKYLASSSSTGTVHIFRLVSEDQTAPERPATMLGTIGGFFSGVASFIPGQPVEAFTQERAFATVHLSSTTSRTVVGFKSSDSHLKLCVACYDGMFHVYEVNKTEGGECRQISQTHLLTLSNNVNNNEPSSGQNRRQPGQTANDSRTHVIQPVRPLEPLDQTTPQHEDFRSFPGSANEDQ